jgi:hypothetical protein
MTAAWYYRLANAAHRGTGDGALSRKLARLPENFRADRIDNLTDRVGLMGPRLLVPVMAALVTRRRPKGLMAEALAVALTTDSTIVVSTDSGLLRDCADDLGSSTECSRHDPRLNRRTSGSSRSLGVSRPNGERPGQMWWS